jgi:hypothetical protein
MFNPRQLPKVLFTVVSLITAAAVVMVILSRRDLHARPGAGAGDAPSASPERAAAEKLVPPAVPDEQNFAATPFLASTLEKGHLGAAADWPDDFSRADQWPRRSPNLRDSPVGQRTGRLITDLVAWQKAFEQSQSLDATRAEIPVSDAPDRTANAQAAIAVLKALEPYQAVLEELQAASSRPQSRFNVRYDLDNPWATLFPHLAVVKRTSQLLRLKTSAELAAGHSEQALRDLTLMLRLAECPASEPTLISQLMRVACLNLAVQPLWEGLAERRWSVEQLQALQARLQQFDFVADLKRVLEAERAWGNLTIALARDKRSPAFIFDPKAKAEAWRTEADRAFASCPRDWFDAEQRNYNEFFDERLLTGFDVEARRFRPGVAEANARFVQAAVNDTESLLNSHLVFAKELLVAPSKVHLKLANAQSTVDLAALACALERARLIGGRYPDTLASLAPRYLRYIPQDLISGQPLHYERTEDGGFLLYSIGWNESDDHGRPGFLTSGRGTEINQGDWVWRYPARR